MHSDDDAHYKRITPAQVTGCPPWGPWAGFVTSPWANLKKTGFFLAASLFGTFPKIHPFWGGRHLQALCLNPNLSCGRSNPLPKTQLMLLLTFCEMLTECEGPESLTLFCFPVSVINKALHHLLLTPPLPWPGLWMLSSFSRTIFTLNNALEFSRFVAVDVWIFTTSL